MVKKDIQNVVKRNSIEHLQSCIWAALCDCHFFFPADTVSPYSYDLPKEWDTSDICTSTCLSTPCFPRLEVPAELCLEILIRIIQGSSPVTMDATKRKVFGFFLTPVVKAECFPISSNLGLEKLVPQSLLYGYGLTFTDDFPRCLLWLWSLRRGRLCLSSGHFPL